MSGCVNAEDDVSNDNSVTEIENNEGDTIADESSPSQDADNQTAPKYDSGPAAGVEREDGDPPKLSQRRHFEHKTDSSIFESSDSDSRDFTSNSTFKKQ